MGALRSRSLPYLRLEVEDGQGDGWQEDGGAALLEVQRNGPVQLPASAAVGLRHLQELRGPLPCGVHGWQRCCHVGQGHLLRAQGGSCFRRQEEVSLCRRSKSSMSSGGGQQRVVFKRGFRS